jgi:hypothetical protein
MLSRRHSVLAKAGRYRIEPERVTSVVDQPLVAIVRGLHAEHTVKDAGQGLVCSCERFRRGEGVCAHVLAVEERRSARAPDAAVTDLGEALVRVIERGATSGNAVSLFDRVVVPVWDLSIDGGSMAWARRFSCTGYQPGRTAPRAALDPRSHDVHAPSLATTDRRDTVHIEHR